MAKKELTEAEKAKKAQINLEKKRERGRITAAKARAAKKKEREEAMAAEAIALEEQAGKSAIQRNEGYQVDLESSMSGLDLCDPGSPIPDPTNLALYTSLYLNCYIPQSHWYSEKSWNTKFLLRVLRQLGTEGHSISPRLNIGKQHAKTLFQVLYQHAEEPGLLCAMLAEARDFCRTHHPDIFDGKEPSDYCKSPDASGFYESEDIWDDFH